MAHQLNPIGEGISPELTDADSPFDRVKVIVGQHTSSEFEIQRITDTVLRTKKFTKFEKRANDQALRLRALELASSRGRYEQTTEGIILEAEKLYAWVTRR